MSRYRRQKFHIVVPSGAVVEISLTLFSRSRSNYRNISTVRFLTNFAAHSCIFQYTFTSAKTENWHKRVFYRRSSRSVPFWCNISCQERFYRPCRPLQCEGTAERGPTPAGKSFFSVRNSGLFVTLNFWRNTAQILKTSSYLYRPIVNLEEPLASKGSKILFSAEGWGKIWSCINDLCLKCNRKLFSEAFDGWNGFQWGLG